MAELTIDEPGEYDCGWETFDHVEINAAPVTLLRCIIIGENPLLWLNGIGSTENLAQYIIKQCIFTNTNIGDDSYWWQIENQVYENVFVRDCVFTGSTRGCFDPGGNVTLTVVNNLFLLSRTWYVFNCFTRNVINIINNTFVVGPGFESEDNYNVIFKIDWNYTTLRLKNNIFSLNSPEMDVIKPGYWDQDQTLDIGTNLIHGSYANWSYSEPPYTMPAPEGNLIKANPQFASQPQNLFELHGHKRYPNGYFLSEGSPAIDAGENAPGNPSFWLLGALAPHFGHLGTTAVDDTPDDVTKSNMIDLGFHYPQLAVTPIPICFLPIGEMWSPKIQE